MIEKERSLDASIEAHRRYQESQAAPLGIDAALSTVNGGAAHDEESRWRHTGRLLEEEWIAVRKSNQEWEAELERWVKCLFALQKN